MQEPHHQEDTEDGGENPFSYKNFMAKDVASRQKRVLKVVNMYNKLRCTTY